MKKFYALLAAMLFTMSMAVTTASAAQVLHTAEDGYIIPNVMQWYLDREYGKSTNYDDGGTPPFLMEASGAFWFDHGDINYTADDIATATLNIHLRKRGGAGRPPIPAGDTFSVLLHAYSTDHVFDQWAAVEGDVYAQSEVDYSHTMQLDVTDPATPLELVSFDVTDIVKGWLDGTYTNYGLRLWMYDNNFVSPIDAPKDGFIYWVSADEDHATYGFNAAPFLDIAPVPVPAAVWLLGAGLVGLIGLRRRN